MKIWMMVTLLLAIATVLLLKRFGVSFSNVNAAVIFWLIVVWSIIFQGKNKGERKR